MSVAALGALWLLCLAAAIGASEILVNGVTALGSRFRLSAALVGLLVALGADGPEVTSALIAVLHGSPDVGVGVVIGSNIFNLAGLLGLCALLAHGFSTGPRRPTADAVVNAALTCLLVAVILVPALHIPFGISLLALLALYAWDLATVQEWITRLLPIRSAGAGPPHEADSTLHFRRLAAMLGGSIVVIVAASDGLVSISVELGSRAHVPQVVTGTVILAVATSLPNVWAAVSLARRRLAASAISATFNSNSINIAFGIGLPSLFTALHAPAATRLLGIWWLAGMTLLVAVLLEVRAQLGPADGAVLLGLYGLFLALQLILFG